MIKELMTREEMFKLVDKEVEVIQQALDKIAEAVYRTAYNKGIEEAAKLTEAYSVGVSSEIRKLKK